MSDLVPNRRVTPWPASRGSGAIPDAEPGHDGASEETLGLREAVQVLRRNKRLVLGLTIACAIAASYLAYTQPPRYRATAVLRLDNERQAMTGAMGGQAVEEVFGRTADPLLSEIQVLRSRTVIGEVADRIGMRLHSLTDGVSIADLSDVSVPEDAGPDTLSLRFSQQVQVLSRGGDQAAQYGDPLYSAGVRFTVPNHPGVNEATFEIRSADWATEYLLENLTARPIERTNVVEVQYTATDPRLARLAVNTAVDEFQKVSVQNALAESSRRRAFIEEQLARTDSALADAQLALSSFREREEIFSSREQFAAQQTGIMELDVRREEMNADRRMYRSLLGQLQDDPDGSGLRTLVSSPGIAQNPVVTQLYTRFVQYRVARDSMVASGRATENPDVQRYSSLMASTQRQLRDALTSHILAVDARIAALDTLRMRNSADIRGLPRQEAEEMRLVQHVETARKVADQLREEYQKAQIAEAIELGQVEIVDLASLPQEPIGSGRGLKVVLGIMIGLMLGSGSAMLREQLNTAVRRRDEIEPLLHIPALGIIPRIPANGTAEASGPRLRLPVRVGNGAVEKPLELLVTVNQVQSSGAEAYRSLRTNLIFTQASGTIQSLLVTSGMPGEGKTTTAANLAVTFAQQGLRVLLVDADMRRPRLFRVFGFSREPGLADVLAGMTPLVECIRPSPVDRLDVITCGTVPPNPSELLGATRMRDLLEQVKSEYDLVIVDAPPVLVAGDASILGTFVDGVVVVLRAGQTNRDAAQATVNQLRSVNARVLGAVLNDPDAKVPGYETHYSYAYKYYGEDHQRA